MDATLDIDERLRLHAENIIERFNSHDRAPFVPLIDAEEMLKTMWLLRRQLEDEDGWGIHVALRNYAAAKGWDNVANAAGEAMRALANDVLEG